MTVRTVVRRGMRRLVIDISYKRGDGTRQRFRRDARVQTSSGALVEERQRLVWLALNGSPDDPGSAPTGAPDVGGAVTLRHAAKRFIELYAETRLKPSTRRGYREVIVRHLLPRLGELDLCEINATTVRELDRDLVHRGARASTRRNVQCVLRSICRFACEQGVIDTLPAWPPLPRVGTTIALAMTDAEVARVVAATPAQYHLALALSRFAGLRASEVRGLRWSDVDFEREVIVVRRARCYDEEAPPKSGHQRLIPLHPALRAMLEMTPRGEDASPVTGPTPGEPWGEFALSRAFARARKKAGVSGFRFHDLRHWFVTALFRAGNAAPVVQRLAGHEHLVTTQRYAHAPLEELRMGIARMAQHSAVA